MPAPSSLAERVAAAIDPGNIGRGRAERYFRDGEGHHRKLQALAKAESILRLIEQARRPTRGPITKRSDLVGRIADKFAIWSTQAGRRNAIEGANRCLALLGAAGLEVRRKRSL